MPLILKEVLIFVNLHPLVLIAIGTRQNKLMKSNTSSKKKKVVFLNNI